MSANDPVRQAGPAITDGRAARTVAFPTVPVRFRVNVAPPEASAAVQWSGGERPLTGSGASFTTTFTTPGAHTVTAHCGADARAFTIVICDLDTPLNEAKAFYGASINFAAVTIKESAVVIGTPWTCNNVIRFKPGDCPDTSSLVHELAHVWEHQSGQTQLLNGIFEQASRSLGRDPYDYGGPTGVHAALARQRRLRHFKKESQAQIIQEYWKSQHGYARDRLGNTFTEAYIADLAALVHGAGIGTGVPAHPTMQVMATGAALGSLKPVDAILAGVVNAALGALRLVGAERAVKLRR